MNYDEWYEYVNKHYPVHKIDKWGTIDAVYAPDEEALSVIKRFFELGKGYPGHTPVFKTSEWRGPDWYFSEYTTGDVDSEEWAYLRSKWEIDEMARKKDAELKEIVEEWKKR